MEIYLDNAATTKPCKASLDAVVETMTTNYGNPSSLHKKGLDAYLQVSKARLAVATALGCDTDEVVFTSCATESSNTALKSVAKKYGRRKKKIIASAVEHSSVKNVLKYLEENGYEVIYIKPKNGKYEASDFINAADDNTFLVTCMMVNNETGYLFPVKEIFKGIKRLHPDVICHCDAVQGFMKLPFTVENIGCDLLSISAHKVYAPKGSGVLYIKKGIKIHPLLLGGGQEKGVRSGTESVPMISGFGAAVKFLRPKVEDNFIKYRHLKKILLENLEETDYISINSDENCVPYIINITVSGVRSEIMLHFLETKEIYVSSGSACSKGKDSGVLENFGLSGDAADSALRISLSYQTTDSDILALCDAIKQGHEQILKK